MASSIYVYNNKNDYDNLYKGKREAPNHESPILDFYLKEDHLWVVTNNTPNLLYRPDISRTIVLFTNGNCFGHLEGDELLVEKDKMSYNPKNNMLEFYPGKLKSPKLSLRVDKIVGGRPVKKTKLDFKHKYYDMVNNRLNLFL